MQSRGKYNLKGKWRIFRELWKIFKYDKPEELCIVTRYRVPEKEKPYTSLTDFPLSRKSPTSLGKDLRKWSLSLTPKMCVITHSSVLKRLNEADGFYDEETRSTLDRTRG